MYGFPRTLIPNDGQWNHHRAPHNHQWRPFHGPRASFHPRNQTIFNRGPPMHGGSEEHWCETCDRGFPNEDLLNKHKQQHQKCNIDGCQFIAHPKVITKHIQMQHSSGLYKKIAKLNNPEEIDKWREERKKKYPTKINIDKKAAELKEKIDRGEKMSLGRKDWHNKRDKSNQNRNFDSSVPGQGMKRSYNTDDKNQPESKLRKPNRKKTNRPPNILPAPEEKGSLAPFAGIQYLEIESDEEVDKNINNDLIEDDEIRTIIDDDLEVIQSEKSTIVETPVVCGALSFLMCEYGSSDDEINDNKQDFKGKEVNKIGKSTDIEKSTPQLAKISNENDSLNKIKNSNEVEINTQKPQQINATGICVKSHEVLLNLLKVGVDNVDADEDSKPEEIKAAKSENSVKSNDNINSKSDDIKDTKFNNNEVDDNDSGPEEIKVDKNTESTNVLQKNNEVNKIKKKKVEVVRRKPHYRKTKPKLPSTLIYRLLANEMKQERNKVLQCIRYIRKNNYFDKSI